MPSVKRNLKEAATKFKKLAEKNPAMYFGISETYCSSKKVLDKKSPSPAIAHKDEV